MMNKIDGMIGEEDHEKEGREKVWQRGILMFDQWMKDSTVFKFRK